MGDAPLSYLRTYGPSGDPITRLGWGLGAVSVAVVLIVGGLLAWALWRRREEPADPLALAPRGRTGLRLMTVGVAISTVVLFACAAWTALTLAAVARPPAAPALVATVIGHQWWWEVRYAGEPESTAFVTANELHVPVGQPVRLRLKADDVIHSFWVPQLGGKTDTLPGTENLTWLQADRPGVYVGQCTEYCGAQHAHMGFVVVAQSPDELARWRAAQLAVPAAAGDGPHEAQRALFEERCGSCHTVRGTQAGGLVGPDLSHVMDRRTLAAGLLPNTPANLKRWIADAPALKPGTQMPAMRLPAAELDAIVAFVASLR